MIGSSLQERRRAVENECEMGGESDIERGRCEHGVSVELGCARKFGPDAGSASRGLVTCGLEVFCGSSEDVIHDFIVGNRGEEVLALPLL